MTQHHPLKERNQKIVNEVLSIEGVGFCALVSREGMMMCSGFLEDEETIPVPSFAALSATMLASGGALTGMVCHGQMSSVVMNCENGYIVLVGAGKKALISTFIDISVDLFQVKEELIAIAKRVGGDL